MFFGGGDGNYAYHGGAYSSNSINNVMTLEEDGTITLPSDTTTRIYSQSGDFPSTWLSPTPGTPSNYWFRATVVSEIYVSGGKIGTFGSWVQMNPSGIQYGAGCSYNSSNGAGEADLTFDLEIALSAGGPAIATARFWCTAISVAASPP